MSRRKVGIARLKADQERREKLSSLGSTMEKEKSSSVAETLQSFKQCLTDFAGKHRDKINDDPEFRMQFHKMCNSVGVDPLASSKGFWSDILGYGDFYFELGIVIIQICLQTRSSNGGLLSLIELMDKLKIRSQNQSHKHLTTTDDVLRSIEKLSALGGGFRIININNKQFILSIPLEINNDHEILLKVAHEVEQNTPNDSGITQNLLLMKHGWSNERFHHVLTPLLYEGIVWVDDSNNIREKSYYFPTISVTEIA
jgi:ESCRT-II complex subunit VPS22